MNNLYTHEDLPVANPIDILKRHPVKVLWSKAFWGQYNSLFDIFYSFCRIKENFISLHGEMNIETFHKRRRADSKIAKLYKCEYELSQNGLIQTNKKYIGLGADPRMVSNGKSAYAYVTGYGKAGYPAFLYVEKDDSLHPLKADADFVWGKNWQPFLKDDRLFIVHELSPYTVYEINLETYTLEQRTFVHSSLGLTAHFTNYTMFRGGANAIAEDDAVYGLGRASAQPYKHLPFLWSSYLNESPVFQFVDFFYPFNVKGFSILDPTSFFKGKDNLYIGLACSETCWFHEQQFLNILLVFDIENKYDNLPTLENFLSSFEDSYSNHQVNLRKHIFHCDRMQHDIAHTYEYGVKSAGIAGTLVYGPYIEITEAMTIAVELSYLTTQEEGSRAGVFDVYLSRKKSNHEIDFVKATECELKSTDKEIEKAILFFDTGKYIGYNIEFRVLVEEGYELNAFHIRTNRVEHPIVCSSLPANIEVDNSNGLRSSKGQEGFLFFGPYQVIKKEGIFTAKLYYKADALASEVNGVFDITVSSPENEMYTISKTEVMGTENKWACAKLNFSLDNYSGYKLETRLYIKDKTNITANYILISEQSR